MTTALTTARPNRKSAAAVIAGTFQEPRIGGKALARAVGRKQPSVNPATSWDAWRTHASRVADDRKLSGWVALDLALAFADLKVKDLEARIAALESQIVPTATAKATPPKAERPLHLKLLRPIDDASVAPLVAKIKAAHGRPVKLALMSEGGEVSAAQLLADEIVRHGDVTAHALVNCSSATILVFSAARLRECLKNTRFHFHAPNFGTRDAQTAEERRQLDQCARDMAAFLANRASVSSAKIRKLMTPEGVTLDGAQMSELGLLNGIIKRPHTPKKGKAR